MLSVLVHYISYIVEPSVRGVGGEGGGCCLLDDQITVPDASLDPTTHQNKTFAILPPAKVFE